MTKAASIRRNIASNASGYFVHTVVALLLWPFVLASLGDELNGLWQAVVAVTGYYGLLDLGIRSAVGQYATRYWAARDIDGVNRTITTALVVMLVVAGLILAASFVLAAIAGVIFGVSPEHEQAVVLTLIIMALNVAWTLGTAVLGVATYATRRFDIANVIGISERLISAGLIYWTLSRGHGIVGVAISVSVAGFLSGLVRVWLAFRLMPGLRIGRRYWSRASLKELGGYGFYNFLVNAADRVITNLDAIVILVTVSAVAVTRYDNGAKLIPYFIMLVSSIAFTLTPYATACDSRGDREALRRLWVDGSRGIFVFAAWVGAGMIFLGGDFLRLWIGQENVSGGELPGSEIILQVLAVAAVIRLGMTCGKQICFAVREMRFLARVSLIEAVLNVVLSVVLVQFLGLLGVAIATLVPMIFVYLWIQPVYVARLLEVDLRRFYAAVLPAGLAVMGSMGGMAWLLADAIDPSSYGGFLAKASAISIPAALVGFRDWHDQRRESACLSAGSVWPRERDDARRVSPLQRSDAGSDRD